MVASVESVTQERDAKLVKHFKGRLEALKASRRPMEVLWEYVDQSILPYTYSISDEAEKTPDVTINKKIFDGETINASITAANSFAAAVASRSTTFFETIPDREDVEFDFDRQAEIERYCKYHQRVITSSFAKSNFFEEVVSFCKKGFDYGTSAQYAITNEKGEIRYITLGKKTYYIDENDNGEVDTLWRCIWMQNIDIIKDFGDMLDEIQYNALDKQPYARSMIYHIVEPRSDFKKDAKIGVDRKFASYYVIPRFQWKILEESGFDAFPYFVWRQYREPGFVWGFGSGIYCIRDAMVLQAAGRTLTDFANRSVDPAYALPKSIEGDEELFPGGRMFIDPEEAKGIVQIGAGSQYPYGVDLFQKIRDGVNKHYLIPIFQVMNSIRNQSQGGDITATETDALRSESMTVISSITSGFFSQYMDYILEDATARNLKTGALVAFQSRSFNLRVPRKGFNINFEYVGTLAMAQKMYQKISGAEKTLQRLLPVSQYLPSILDNIDEDEYAMLVGEANNSLRILKSPKVRDKMRSDRAQAQQAQMQAQMQLEAAKVQAEVASKGGKAPESGSLAAQQQGGGK